MDKVFGLPMSGIATVLVALLALCLLSVAWVAWRRPVIFKLGVRNIPRRRAQTSLIVIGLMLSTLIILAALGTGDTLDYSLTKDVYDNYGNVDTVVVFYQNQPYELTVAGISEDTYLSGYRRGREDFLEYPGLVMPLPALQALTGQAGKLSAIAISGTGG